MNYVTDERVYHISVESPVSISYCLVQCDADVQLMDAERNLAILSIIKQEKTVRKPYTLFCQY